MILSVSFITFIGDFFYKSIILEASRMVYEGVRDVRRAVLQMRDPDTWDDSDVEHSQVSQAASAKTNDTLGHSDPTRQAFK